jgi:hypothetical protein
MARYADEAGDLARVTRYSDEAADLGRVTRYGDELGDASRAYRVGEHSVARYGRGPFDNRMADRLAGELERADALGIRPITPEAANFDDLVNADRIKWAVTTDGELRIVPYMGPDLQEVPHSVLTRGAPVLAAGEADIAAAGGIRVGSAITPHSGHFQPSLESLEVGREAFARYGITFPPTELP